MLTIILSVVSLVVSALLTLFAAVSLRMNTYAWWNPHTRRGTHYTRAPGSPELTFSIILPCRNEAEPVMRATVQALLAQSHGAPQIVISVGHDDPETVATAHLISSEHPEHVLVSVDHNERKSKPIQLNTALALCTGDIVGVFDAESIAAPELLRHVDASFETTGADAVQGAVQLVNYKDSWYALRNCLEYFAWFRSRLHAQAEGGFIPLGGTTVFVRRELLVSLGGWDGNCLAEDCDLGVRLSTLGHKIVVAYAPELVTREETPDSLGSLIRQRTRWSLGFMQVYAKGDWRRIPSIASRQLARWTLTQHHAMALAGLALPINLGLAIWGGLPLLVTLIAFIPLVLTVATIMFDVCMLHEFLWDHGLKARFVDYAKLIVFTPVYQVVLALAAVRALVKYIRKDLAWEKTTHVGAHLSPPTDRATPATSAGAA